MFESWNPWVLFWHGRCWVYFNSKSAAMFLLVLSHSPSAAVSAKWIIWTWYDLGICTSPNCWNMGHRWYQMASCFMWPDGPRCLYLVFPCFPFFGHLPNISGWWFEPLWKIWVNWDDDYSILFPIDGKIIQSCSSQHQPDLITSPSGFSVTKRLLFHL